MRRARGYMRATAVYLMLIAVSLLALAPSAWIVVSSFKTSAQTLAGDSPLWPSPFSLAGYVDVFSQADLLLYIGNTLLYAVGGTVGALTVAFLAAYPLTRFSFRGGNTLTALFSVALAIPIVGLATPEFFVIRQLGLFDSRVGMIIFYAAFLFPLSFVILRAFLASLPPAMEEAAVLDGASYFRILFRIVLPLSRPAVATVAVVCFVIIWNEFFFVNLFTLSAENQNVQVALAAFRSQFGFNVSAMLAGTAVVMLVPIAVFLAAQRQVIAGLTAGATR